MKLTLIILTVLCLHASSVLRSAEASNPLLSYEVVYGWKELDYQFPSNQTRTRLISTKEYIRENNIPTGLKVSGNRLFLTVPRWREGVPATLVSVEFNSPQSPSGSGGSIYQEVPKGPLLSPYPSWEMNQLGNCKAFQYIQSMEIDQFNRMWVVDIGRVNIFSANPVNKCPPKLVLIDLGTNEILRSYEFPSTVVSPTGNFLNDVVVGCTSKDDCFAYITDALESKIVVYNYAENRSSFVHHSSMVADPSALIINVLGANYTFNTNVDGLALSPKDSNFDRLYYCPLSSLKLFSVPTSVLRSSVNGINLEDTVVTDHGLKSSQSDGLAMDSKGVLFYGLLSTNGVSYFNTSDKRLNGTNEVLLIQNDIDLQWPDTFGFDDKGYLYMTTNRLPRFKSNAYDFTEINFRVVRVYIGSRSYMFSGKEAIASSSGDSGISTAAIDANPVTNMDTLGQPVDNNNKNEHDHPKNKYDTLDTTQQNNNNNNHGGIVGSNNGEEVPKSDSNKGDAEAVPNSSIQIDVYSGTLVFVLAAFVFHPAI